MKSTKMRILATGGAIALASVTLTGCTMNFGFPFFGMGNGNMMGSNRTAEFSGADIMFAQMMIPHHQQAVDMGTLAETRAENPEVKALAATIKAEQAPEIEQMKGWLQAAGASTQMGHDMGMGGMMTAAQMLALENSSGNAFDKLYVAGMIAHHQGAIQMAKMVIGSANAEANALGEAIVESQTKQIEQLQALLATL
jgi:uncharacterized protein (DUF305 family)